METSFTYTEDGKCWFSSDEKKTINRILKLKERYPDEVTIRAYPENNGGCIYGYCTSTWVKLSPPRKVEYSEETRARRAENMRKLNVTMGNRINEKESASAV